MNAIKTIILAMMLSVPAMASDVVTRDATEAELVVIKRDLSYTNLRDPFSAELRGIKVRGDMYCGFINAKNGFGAYTGFTPIIGMIFEGKVAPAVGTGPSAGKMCKQEGFEGFDQF